MFEHAVLTYVKFARNTLHYPIPGTSGNSAVLRFDLELFVDLDCANWNWSFHGASASEAHLIPAISSSSVRLNLWPCGHTRHWPTMISTTPHGALQIHLIGQMLAINSSA